MRTRHSREAFESLRQHYGDKLFPTTIRASIAYAESAERATSIIDYRPRPRASTTSTWPTRCWPGSVSSRRGGGWPLCDEQLTMRPPLTRQLRHPVSGLELLDVGAARFERRAHHASPIPATSDSSAATMLPVCSNWHHTSTVGPAPEIVAPSAPSSRGALQQLGRARVEVGALGLV